MALEFKKAKREQVKIKISIAGPAGSGKTMSSLLLAYGLIRSEYPTLPDEEIWDKIGIIDTESGSGALYVGKQVGATTIGAYNTIELGPPFEPGIFVDAIHMMEQHGMAVIIIDSLTHAWSGAGGALDMQGKIAERTSSWAAWRTVTPQHNKLVDAILQSSSHVIANLRAKMDYQQVEENGKKQVKALGMGAIFREGVEYEFGISFMLDYNHVANATKDRTGLFDQKYFVIDPSVGAKIYQWLSSGAAPTPKAEIPAPTPAPSAPDEQLTKAIAMIDALAKEKAALPDGKKIVGDLCKEVLGVANYKKCQDINKLRELYQKLNELQ